MNPSSMFKVTSAFDATIRALLVQQVWDVFSLDNTCSGEVTKVGGGKLEIGTLRYTGRRYPEVLKYSISYRGNVILTLRRRGNAPSED